MSSPAAQSPAVRVEGEEELPRDRRTRGRRRDRSLPLDADAAGAPSPTLVFASSVFVPVASMPDWLQALAKVSPVTLTANAGRTYALDGAVPGLAIVIPLCVWCHRRMS